MHGVGPFRPRCNARVNGPIIAARALTEEQMYCAICCEMCSNNSQYITDTTLLSPSPRKTKTVCGRHTKNRCALYCDSQPSVFCSSVAVTSKPASLKAKRPNRCPLGRSVLLFFCCQSSSTFSAQCFLVPSQASKPLPSFTTWISAARSSVTNTSEGSNVTASTADSAPRYSR